MIRLDRLNFRQAQMFKIGNVGVAAVKRLWWFAWKSADRDRDPDLSSDGVLGNQGFCWYLTEQQCKHCSLTLRSLRVTIHF